MKPEGGAATVSTQRSSEIGEALAAYGYRLLADPEPVENSVRNENYRVVTDGGPLFVRFHRPTRSMDRLLREHRAIQWASEQGLPVVTPLRSKTGDTLNQVNGRVVAVFRWVNGRPPKRGEISADRAAAMGAMHGRLHAVFARYRDAELPWFWDSWGPNTEGSAEAFGEYLEQLPSFDLSSGERADIRQCLETQIDYLGSERPLSLPEPQAHGVQPVHGDYHERNLLLDAGDQVAAVVDWDTVALMPRAFEPVRCLTFADLLEPHVLEAYLTVYREHTVLTAEECAEAVELWWQFSLRDAWLPRTRLIEGDPLVQPFFAEQIAFLARFGDRSFRDHLAAELRRLAGAGGG